MTTLQERLGPAIDPLVGAVRTADGRDWAPIAPTDRSAWALAIIRAKLWQFAGQWRYDLSKGIDYYTKILGVVPDLRVVQELYRAELSSVIQLDKLLITADGDELIVQFAGVPGSGIAGTFSFFEQPTQTKPTIKFIENQDFGTVIWFSEDLDRWSVPTPTDFELDFGVVTSVQVQGEQLRLGIDWSAAPDVSVLRYLPGLKPLRSRARVPVDPFRLVRDVTGEFLLASDGVFLVTEGGLFISVN